MQSKETQITANVMEKHLLLGHQRQSDGNVRVKDTVKLEETQSRLAADQLLKDIAEKVTVAEAPRYHS